MRRTAGAGKSPGAAAAAPGDCRAIAAGFPNLTNTCYINATLQCLSHVTPLSAFFIEGRHEEGINRKSETKGKVARAYADLVKRLWARPKQSDRTRDNDEYVWLFGCHINIAIASRVKPSNTSSTLLPRTTNHSVGTPITSGINHVHIT